MTDEQLQTMEPNALFVHLLNTKYLPAYADRHRIETERRTDAFAEGVTLTVCGEELRMMTPRDLFVLDALENAFVCYAKEPTPDDAAFFLWQLNAANDGSRSLKNLWRRGRARGRFELLGSTVEADYSEIYGYCDRIWIETPPEGETAANGKDGAQERKPPSVYCLASLFVNVAGVMGAIDPMSGRPLVDSPIPRLLQYQRAAYVRENGSKDDASSFDSMRSRCLEEVNTITAKRRAT